MGADVASAVVVPRAFARIFRGVLVASERLFAVVEGVGAGLEAVLETGRSGTTPRYIVSGDALDNVWPTRRC